jgi:hypothetical protein
LRQTLHNQSVQRLHPDDYPVEEQRSTREEAGRQRGRAVEMLRHPDISLRIPSGEITVVIARSDEDVGWLDARLRPMGLRALVYQAAGRRPHTFDPAGFPVDISQMQRRRPRQSHSPSPSASASRTPARTRGMLPPTLQYESWGREAAAFLSYIVEHYYNLPPLVVMLHAHETSYHTFGKNATHLLSLLRWEEARRRGYTSLNLRMYSPICNKSGNANWDLLQSRYWSPYFIDLGPAPGDAAAYCCAQFVVTKERILARSLEFYDGLLRFVANPSIAGDAARMLEHSWHMIFSVHGSRSTGNVEEQLTACDVVHDCENPVWMKN